MHVRRSVSLLAVLFLLGSGCVVQAQGAVRIDATSDATAQASWHEMLAEASPEQKQKLQIALLELNLAGVQSAYDVASNPALQHPSIAHIKDKVAGLTASQIIELASHTSTVQVRSSGG